MKPPSCSDPYHLTQYQKVPSCRFCSWHKSCLLTSPLSEDATNGYICSLDLLITFDPKAHILSALFQYAHTRKLTLKQIIAEKELEGKLKDELLKKKYPHLRNKI